MTDERFDPNLLELLAREAEVRIVTSRGHGSEQRRTIIWVVVDSAGRVLDCPEGEVRPVVRLARGDARARDAGHHPGAAPGLN